MKLLNIECKNCGGHDFYEEKEDIFCCDCKQVLDADGLLELGYLYETEYKDIQSANKYYLKAAQLGNRKAQYNLGLHYEEGTGFRKNISKAIYWYLKAANQGHEYAQYSLGNIYKEIKKDDVNAFKWYLEAAKQNNPFAQAKVGLAYETGKGVNKDIELAIDWYTKAAFLGSKFAKYSLGHLFEERKDYITAISWYESAGEIDKANELRYLYVLKTKEK